MHRSDGRRNVQRALLIYFVLFVGLNVMTWGWFALHRHTPGHHFPLGNRAERFGDLLRFSARHQIGDNPDRAEYGLAGTLFPRNYPPFSVAIYLFLLERCAPYALVVMLALSLLPLVAACVLLWRRVRALAGYRWYMGAAIFLTGLFGWGTVEMVTRGNIEGLMLVCILIGTSFFVHRRYGAAAIGYALATCIKPYPILWLFLLARHRKYRAVAVGVLSAGIATIASLLIIDRNPVRAWQRISAKSSFFQDYIVAFRPMEEMKGDHSVFQSMKTIARIVRYHGMHLPAFEYGSLQSNDPLAWKLYLAYRPIAVAIGLLVVWAVWNKPILNQIFAVCCISTLLPLIAADYTLAVLVIPLGLFLVFLLEKVATGIVAMSFGRILWFVLPSVWITGTEPLTILHGILKCIATLVLLVASITIPLPSKLEGSSGVSESNTTYF